MNATQHVVRFFPSGRGKAQCAPNPAYPAGIEFDGTQPGEETCRVKLTYPAPECGVFIVDCHKCRITVGVTAAGRPDDPIAVRIPCTRAPDGLASYRRKEGEPMP